MATAVGLGRLGCSAVVYPVIGSDTTSGVVEGEDASGEGVKQYGDMLCTFEVGFGVRNS